MITSLLKNAYDQKKLVDINIYDTENEDSIIGYVTEINDEYFTVKEIDKFGNYNGSTIYAVDRIKNLSLDNWYLRNLKVIMDNHLIFNQDLRITVWKAGKELIPHFQYLKEQQVVIMIFFDDDDFEIGILVDFDSEMVSFKNIGQDGYELGITHYFINNIRGLKYNGLGEQKTNLLYDTFKDTGDRY